MKLRMLLLLISATLLFTTTLAAEEPDLSAVEVLNILIEDFEQFELDNNPIRAGREGDLDALARWPDVSVDAVRLQHGAHRDFYDRLRAIDSTDLSGADRINYIVLDYVLGSRVELGAFERERMPFTNDSGFFPRRFRSRAIRA